MISPALENVFANAAPPQKAVLIGLVAAIPMILFAAILASKALTRRGFWSGVIAFLGMAGPALGLFVGGLNSFHMGETIRRLPFDPTLKQLAPGIFEVSTLVSLGALVGLVALFASAAVNTIAARQRTS